MNENKIVLRKHRAIIQMTNVKAVQRKAYNVMLKQAYDHIEDDRFSISLAQLKSFAGIRDSSNKRVKESLIELMTTIVQMDIINGSPDHWKAVPLLGEVEIVNGTVYFDLPRTIRQAIQSPDRYAVIDLSVIKGLRSKYAIALYELAKDYQKKEIPKISIEDFRKLMGIEEGKYTNFADLKRYVINRAIEEIEQNDRIPFILEAEPIKGARRKIEAIKFHIKKKEPKQPSLPIPKVRNCGGATGNEWLDPAKYREYIIQEYRGKALCNRVPGWKPGVTFGISKAGYICRMDTGEDISGDDAKKIWRWLFEKQDRAGVVEEVSEIEEIVEIMRGKYTVINGRNALGGIEEIKFYPEEAEEDTEGKIVVSGVDEFGKAGKIIFDDIDKFRTFAGGLKDA
jgi:hypothetical protein